MAFSRLKVVIELVSIAEIKRINILGIILTIALVFQSKTGCYI